MTDNTGSEKDSDSKNKKIVPTRDFNRERSIVDRVSRRKVIQATSALGAFSLVPSTVTASNNNTGTSVKESGISDEFNELIEECKMDEAFALLDEYNVNHTKVTDTPSSDSEGVSTQDFYEKSNSSVTFYTSEWDSSKDQYAIGLGWTVENANNDVDGPAPVDVAVLGFEQDVFGYVDDSLRSSGVLEDYDGSPSASGITNVLSEPGSAKTDAPDNGAVAEFDDDFRNADLDNDGVNDFYPTGQGVIQMVLRKQNTSTKGTVSGLYTHTWSVFNVSDYNVLANVSIPLPAGITVSVPSGADEWQLPDSNDRDEDL